jgi:hypothetical protein
MVSPPLDSITPSKSNLISITPTFLISLPLQYSWWVLIKVVRRSVKPALQSEGQSDPHPVGVPTQLRPKDSITANRATYDLIFSLSV